MKSRKQLKINLIDEDILAQSVFISRCRAGGAVYSIILASARSRALIRGCVRTLLPLCFRCACNEFDVASLLQVRRVVTSKLALTCCKLVSHLYSCRVNLAVTLLQTKIAIWAVLFDLKRELLGFSATKAIIPYSFQSSLQSVIKKERKIAIKRWSRIIADLIRPRQKKNGGLLEALPDSFLPHCIVLLAIQNWN
ncbi:hypothetical protein AVEN_183478-1 [Araneus ventricosus]|uniref:Uncharacterized protein n=1 Tax=Araneus ventricosus TaxID=182803 RepID=A0A4Y2XAL5_ARAVE|nr:hypothetical protein AVEN_183478-1 [Araneus ventricosus]